jgi:hypothetical protein
MKGCDYFFRELVHGFSPLPPFTVGGFWRWKKISPRPQKVILQVVLAPICDGSDPPIPRKTGAENASAELHANKAPEKKGRVYERTKSLPIRQWASGW